ncbi:hypothetical protein PENSPDRAFT_670555 [Peniophora sp. CONT]|nr:hypothetical protein PENSPDRAFT_670555 [Peniophora sp. CONT]
MFRVRRELDRGYASRVCKVDKWRKMSHAIGGGTRLSLTVEVRGVGKGGVTALWSFSMVKYMSEVEGKVEVLNEEEHELATCSTVHTLQRCEDGAVWRYRAWRSTAYRVARKRKHRGFTLLYSTNKKLLMKGWLASGGGIARTWDGCHRSQKKRLAMIPLRDWALALLHLSLMFKIDRAVHQRDKDVDTIPLPIAENSSHLRRMFPPNVSAFKDRGALFGLSVRLFIGVLVLRALAFLARRKEYRVMGCAMLDIGLAVGWIYLQACHNLERSSSPVLYDDDGSPA